MRTIFWFFYFWITLVALIPDMRRTERLTNQGNLVERDEIVHRRVHGWMSSLLRIAGVTAEVSGQENIPEKPVVFVSNHQGNFDIPILLCNLDKPHGVVAKVELQSLPLVRIWMRYLGCVFIDRNNPRKSASALNEATENIRNGQSMIVFPEGTRSRSDRIGEFKAGGFKIAAKTGVPIVPVCINGSYRIMEANHMWIKPATVQVRILPPVETATLSKEDFKGIGDVIRDLIISEKMN